MYLLGGPAALDPSIDERVRALGYVPQRVAGPNRFATAVTIANALGDPHEIIEASGRQFADALSEKQTVAAIRAKMWEPIYAPYRRIARA